MRPRLLVLYASTHGHTGRIAERMADVAQEQGCDVTLLGADRRHEADNLSRYEGVIVGASVHAGHHQGEIIDWLTEEHEELNNRTSAFFSVSLSAADDTDEARADCRRLIQDLLEITEWKPTTVASFAGALQYREYHLPTRVLMRLIARRHHQPTDVSRDVDYTDWEAVESFARDIAGRLAHHSVPS